MRFSEIVKWFKERQRSSFLIIAALILVVVVALLSTVPPNQDSFFSVFAKNLFVELLGAVTVAIIAGVFYERLFAKTVVEQIAIYQEKSMSKVSKLVYQLEETTVEISSSKARMIELLDKGISISKNEKTELHMVLARIPNLIEQAKELHFEYLSEIGKAVPTLEVQKEQYLQKKDQSEKFLSAGFLLESAYQKRDYSRVLSILTRWAKDYPEIHFYIAQLRARIGNYPKAIDSLKKVINNEHAYKYCVDQGQGQRISDLYQEYQLQLDIVQR